MSVAAAVWGDASLWYKIAEANGMSGGETLVAGMSLIIPNKVINVHNNAGTFKPYDPNDALGNLAPNALDPTPKAVAKRNKCGTFGVILMIAVAAAVTAVLPQVSAVFKTLGGKILGAMLASGVSQGVGIAAGIQDRFSFKQVAMAGLTAGIGGGLDKLAKLGSGFAGQMVQGALVNAATQGVAVATGLQDKFDWAGVAAAGIGQMVSSQINMGGAGGRIARTSADALAGAAARSVLTGTSFGDNVLAVLPDVIGRSIGNEVGMALGNRGTRSGLPPTLQDVPLFADAAGAFGPPLEPLDAQLGDWVNHLPGVNEEAIVVTGSRARVATPAAYAAYVAQQEAREAAEAFDLRSINPDDNHIAGMHLTPYAPPAHEVMRILDGDPQLHGRLSQLLVGYGGGDADSYDLGLAALLISELPASADPWTDSTNYGLLRDSVRIVERVASEYRDGAYIADDLQVLQAELYARAPLGFWDGPIGEDGITTTIATAGAGIISELSRKAIAGGVERVAAAGSAIPRIGGRLPINSRYAGQVHPSGVAFTERGFPNFRPYSQAEVEITNLTGRYSIDSRLANEAMGYPSTPKGYVWHHVEDGVTMQLIPKSVHNSVRHTGGAAVIRNGGFD